MTPEPGLPRAQHHMFAHRIIPQVFFGGPARFFELLARDGDAFLRFYWDRIGERVASDRDRVAGGAPHGEIRDLPGGFRAALITLPPPEYPTEAYFIAAVFRPGLDGNALARYYTLELGLSVFDSSVYTVLGGWLPGGYVAMGEGPAPELEAFAAVVQAHLSEEPAS